MRLNRLTKLAELKKIAATSGPLDVSEISAITTWIDSKRKALGEDYINSAVVELAQQIYSQFLSENKDKLALNPLNQDNFKKYIISYIIYFLLSSVTADSFTIKMIRPSMGLSGTPEELEALQLTLANNIVDGRAALPDNKEWNKENKASSGVAGKAGGTVGPQTTRRPAAAKTPINLKAGDTVSDSWGTYTGVDQYSFNFESSNGKEGVYNSTKSGWEQSAATINKLVADKAGTTATPAAKTQTPATTTPAATEAVKPATSETNPIAVANVKAVLSRAGTKALAFWTRRNEMGRINDMLEKINAAVYNGRGNNDVNIDYLARVVYSENKSRLGAFVDNSDMSGAIYRATPDQLKTARKGEYSQLVAEVLNAMNGVYDKQKRDNDYFSKLKGKAIERPAAKTETAPAAVPPATPPVAPTVAPPVAPPAATTPTPAPAVPIAAASRVDPRIKKLATLRRLRVRGQMEAATESSTRFGRSRVS